MTLFFRNLLILGWKCQILRRRSIIITILEFLFPVAIFLLQSSIFQILFLDKEKHSPKALGKAFTMTAKKLNDVNDYTMFFPFSRHFDLMYAPGNNFSDKIMEHVFEDIKQIQSSAKISQESKQTEEELVQWLKNKSVSYSSESTVETPAMGILFSKIDSSKKQYSYELRTTCLSMITNDVEDGKMSFLDYLKSTFLGTQIVLDKTLLWNAEVQDELPWLFGNLPTEEDEVFIVTLILYVFLVFAYLFLVVSVIKDVVDEKECGTKELTKVMGVNSWMIWFHWFVYTMLVQLPVIVAATVMLTVWKPVAISAGVLIVFLLFLLFTINLTIMLFAVSCLFYKTTSALTTCLISWFVLNLLIYIMVIVKPDKVNILLELLFSFFPLPNLCWSLSSLWSFQSNGVKWTWGHLFTKGFTKFRLSVGASIAIFILSSLLSTFILIYLDAIYPGPYGVPKPLTFICQWITEKLTSRESFEYSEIIHESPENFEPVGKNAKVGIALRGLHKRFGLFKKVVAVENVDLDIYEGEIMALLGHNGAGKTTTMSMITGMTAPTNGVIMFEGENITVNKAIFRENLGLCPQHNLYFSKLTVIEHLMFFGMLKGMSYSKSKSSGKSLLYSLNMLDKASTRGSKLSGGMKRRLCLAVSLTGNPKVVILDEPTSGLDPETRRLLWDIILKMRGERTVLITTHFMEEADVLGDRIAIMDHGRVVCCGTSLFLKKLFGAGYQVHVLKTPKAPEGDISSVVKQYMPQTQVRVVSDVQVDYIIKEEFLEKFPSLFSALESQKRSLAITGITLTCASMEDVFLKVAALPIGNSSKSVKDEPQSTALNINEFERVEGKELFFQKLKGLFARRIIYRKRHIVSLLIKSFFILFIMMYLTLSSQIARNKYEEQKQLLLNLKLYPDATVLMAYDEYFNGIGDAGKKVAKILSGSVKILPSISDLEDYLQKELSDNNYKYIRKILFALTFTREGVTVRYHARRNVHAPAIAINFLTNVLLLNKTNGTGMIQAVNHPYVNTHALGVCDKSNNDPLSLEMLVVYPFLLFFSLGFIILLGDFLWSITEERVTGFKHQLFLAGASPPVYWVVNLTFDLCVYFIVTLLLLMVFSIFGPKITLMHFYWFGLLLLVFFLQGCSGISLTYLYSFLVDSPGTSFALYNVLMICLGMFPALVVSTGILSLFPILSFPLFLIISHLLCLNPVSATILCLRFIIKAIVFEEFCRVCTDEICYKDSEVLRMPTEDDRSGILSYLAVLIFTAILYPLIVILVDCGLVRKVALLIMNKEPDFYTATDTDRDVKKETAQVEAFKYEDKEAPLRVESLEKKYRCGPRAVDKVSFLVMQGDCFGLLGVNGAGKSTTFKMLTAEILPDKGDAYINTFSVKTDRIEYMRSVGYCPQFDAILPSLTGEEMLSIIAKIRGIPSVDVRNAVTLWLDMMGILEYGEKCCGTYSGGTKRKLSTAMALIGSPEVVFMDEPTTGVDPASRRKLWTVIKDMQKQGQAVVLTSHSMEECEALCTRLTIMVGGRMKCIGSAEYLKTKFGKGFTVLLKLNDHTAEELELLKKDFDELFPDNSIKDEHEILINYTILNPKILLSQLFTDLLQFKRDHPIVADFTAANTTLEELFLSFASNKQRRRN